MEISLSNAIDLSIYTASSSIQILRSFYEDSPALYGFDVRI
jgi:hypothetical protein